MERVQLTFDFAGLEPKAIANALRMQAALIEGVPPKVASSKKVTSAPAVEEEDDTEVETEEDDEFAAPAKKAKGKKAAAAAFEEEDEVEEVEESDDDEEEIEEEEEKPKKAKKVTADDVNDACKARAAKTGGKEGRAEVLTILKKKFKTASVTDLKPEQYAAVIAAMKA